MKINSLDVRQEINDLKKVGKQILVVIKQVQLENLQEQ